MKNATITVIHDSDYKTLNVQATIEDLNKYELIDIFKKALDVIETGKDIDVENYIKGLHQGNAGYLDFYIDLKTTKP